MEIDKKTNESDSKWIDISYTIEPNMAIYLGNQEFEIERVHDIVKGDGANDTRIAMGTHTGLIYMHRFILLRTGWESQMFRPNG